MCSVLIILPYGFLRQLHRFILSPAEDEGSSCSSFLPILDIVCPFWWCTWNLTGVLIFISLMHSEIDHLLTWPLRYPLLRSAHSNFFPIRKEKKNTVFSFFPIDLEASFRFSRYGCFARYIYFKYLLLLYGLPLLVPGEILYGF